MLTVNGSLVFSPRRRSSNSRSDRLTGLSFCAIALSQQLPPAVLPLSQRFDSGKVSFVTPFAALIEVAFLDPLLVRFAHRHHPLIIRAIATLCQMDFGSMLTN